MPLFVPESKRYQYSSKRRKSAVVYEVIRKYKSIIFFGDLVADCGYNSYFNFKYNF
jgi:hypothetical protein